MQANSLQSRPLKVTAMNSAVLRRIKPEVSAGVYANLVCVANHRGELEAASQAAIYIADKAGYVGIERDRTICRKCNYFWAGR